VKHECRPAMWVDRENVRVIFSQQKRRSARWRTDVLLFAAQDAKGTCGTPPSFYGPCRRPGSLWFIGTYMLAKHLNNSMHYRFQG